MKLILQITLNESIRYATNDSVERWLSDLLCLEATSVQLILSGCPPPDSCDLYYVNRYDTRSLIDLILMVQKIHSSHHFSDLEILFSAIIKLQKNFYVES